MTIVEQVDATKAVAARTKVIDCDIHPALRSIAA